MLAELAPMGASGAGHVERGPARRSRPCSWRSRSRQLPNATGKCSSAPIEAARGMSFEAVFVPGLAEKMFPRKIVEEPHLCSTPLGSRSATCATNHEARRRASCPGASRGRAETSEFCFSYPRLDLDQARPRVPSFYGLEAVRAAEGLLPDFAELARRPRQRRMRGLVGRPRLIQPTPLTTPNTISLFSTVLRLKGKKVRRRQTSVTANPYLARALRTRYQRWGRSWTASDGLLSRSETVRAIMAKHTLGARSYSPTALQNYAKCPYRFFLQAIHGLAPREIPEAIDELDPLQRGSLIHEVQFDLFARLRGDGLLPVRPSNLQQARQRFDVIIAEVAAVIAMILHRPSIAFGMMASQPFRLTFASGYGGRARTDSGYVPWHFELSFGLEHRTERRQADPQSVPGAQSISIAAFSFAARSTSSNAIPPECCASRITRPGKCDAKRSQLIAAASRCNRCSTLLLRKSCSADDGQVTSGRLYFCTSAGGFAEHVVPLDERDALRPFRSLRRLEGLSRGPFLPAAPDSGQCDLCDFRVVCGPYEERRTARKIAGTPGAASGLASAAMSDLCGRRGTSSDSEEFGDDLLRRGGGRDRQDHRSRRADRRIDPRRRWARSTASSRSPSPRKRRVK